MGAAVLVVEDAAGIRIPVELALRQAGFDSFSLPDGDRLEQVLAERMPVVVVLDLNLPGRDGYSLLPVIRSTGLAGVLMLTARDTTEDRVRGLLEGADDYLVKPFSMAELVARVHALARRLGSAPSSVGGLEIHADGARVLRAGAVLDLTETETRLLLVLLRRQGQVLTKQQLLAEVWGYDGFDPNLVEVHVSSLRRKLEEHGPRLIHTLRGRGYRLAESA